MLAATSRSSTARVGAGGREQAPGQQHLARQAVAQHPQDLVPDIRLQPVQRQDHAALPGQTRRAAGHRRLSVVATSSS